jgi:hypothetical protein
MLSGSSSIRVGIVKINIFILLAILPNISCSKKQLPDVQNLKLEGEWVCTDGVEPDIGAWDDYGLKGMIGHTAVIKNGVMKFAIVNLTDGMTQSFNFKIIYPGKILPIEQSGDFDPTQRGALDPKRFKFSDQVIEYKTNYPLTRYTFLVDRTGDKMILDWDGASFLYVPKMDLNK